MSTNLYTVRPGDMVIWPGGSLKNCDQVDLVISVTDRHTVNGSQRVRFLTAGRLEAAFMEPGPRSSYQIRELVRCEGFL